MKMRLALSVVCLLACWTAGCGSKAPPPAQSQAGIVHDEPAPTPPAQNSAAPRPDEPGAPMRLRSSSAILEDAIRAVGTAESWNAHKTMRITLEMTFQGLGITGTGERILTAKNKSLVVTNIPGVGTVREGSNGVTLWSQDPIHGLRTLEDAEAEQARVDSTWNPELRLNELYRKIEAKNEAGPDGKMLECLVLTPKVAPPVTRCFDPRSHLQVLEKGTRATPQGDTPFTSVLSDWREIGGLKMAFAVLTNAGPVTFKGTVKSVVFDEPVDDKMFEPPVVETPPGSPPAKPAAAKKTKKAAAPKK